jgi:hypothetical protein
LTSTLTALGAELIFSWWVVCQKFKTSASAAVQLVIVPKQLIIICQTAAIFSPIYHTDETPTSQPHNIRNPELLESVKQHMTLGFVEALKALEEHIEILKQNLLFLMAERRKPESTILTQKIITIKRELDKAVQERMKLSQILLSSS